MAINFLSVPSVDVDYVSAEFTDHMDPNRIVVRFGPASAQIDVAMARQLSAALDRAIVAAAEAEAKQDRIAWRRTCGARYQDSVCVLAPDHNGPHTVRLDDGRVVRAEVSEA